MIDDLIAGWTALTDAAPGYEEAERYYFGQVPEWFASARISNLIANTGERYRFNLAKTPVNVMHDRVELTSVSVPGDETRSKLIELIWDANDMDVHYPDLFLKMFIYGDSYLQVWPIIEESETDEALEIAGVELTVHNPKHTRVMYDPENSRRKQYVIKRWPVMVNGQETWRVDLYYPDVVERWQSIPASDYARPEVWRPLEDETGSTDDSVLVNEWGEIPFFHYRNALPYGIPEHIAGYGCQDAVTKMLITQLTTTDSHGWPQRWALTDAGAEVDRGNDNDVFGDEDTRGQVAQEQRRAGPGDIEEFVGKKAVGQFDAAEPGVFLDPAHFYVRLMAQLTDTPLHYFDPSGDTPSGESLKVAEAPLVKKISARQVLLRGAVSETWVFVMSLVSSKVARIDVRWAPAASATGSSDWEVIAAKQAAGVPQDQTLIEAGYEVEVVQRWLDTVPESLSIEKRLELLKTLSEAIPRLSEAVTAGLLSQESAASVVSGLIEQAVPAPGTDTAA